MDNADQYTDVFEQLHSHYILITIHDLLDYPLSQLRALAHRLEASLALTPQQQTINQELAQKSDLNCQAKKNKKKIKKSVAIEESFGKYYDLEKTVLQLQKTKESALNAQFDSFDINESVCYENQPQYDWQIGRVVTGLIYDGKLFVKLQVKCEGSPKKQLLGFYVYGDKKTSSIVLKNVQGFRPWKTGKRERLQLQIEGKRHLFEVVQEGSNILGLDFLKEHKVITVCNYRPECFSFELKFTC